MNEERRTNVVDEVRDKFSQIYLIEGKGKSPTLKAFCSDSPLSMLCGLTPFYNISSFNGIEMPRVIRGIGPSVSIYPHARILGITAVYAAVINSDILDSAIRETQLGKEDYESAIEELLKRADERIDSENGHQREFNLKQIALVLNRFC